MKEVVCWEQCCCGEFWCNLHGKHAFECDCPAIEEWKVDPYSAIVTEVDKEIDPSGFYLSEGK